MYLGHLQLKSYGFFLQKRKDRNVTTLTNHNYDTMHLYTAEQFAECFLYTWFSLVFTILC